MKFGETKTEMNLDNKIDTVDEFPVVCMSTHWNCHYEQKLSLPVSQWKHISEKDWNSEKKTRIELRSTEPHQNLPINSENCREKNPPSVMFNVIELFNVIMCTFSEHATDWISFDVNKTDEIISLVSFLPNSI